jgi:hypothetical protein
MEEIVQLRLQVITQISQIATLQGDVQQLLDEVEKLKSKVSEHAYRLDTEEED